MMYECVFLIAMVTQSQACWQSSKCMKTLTYRTARETYLLHSYFSDTIEYLICLLHNFFSEFEKTFSDSAKSVDLQVSFKI